ncbi:MAG: HD domain-containing protein [bacterium]
MLDPIQLIEKYYDCKSTVYQILLVHSEMVTQKALALAERVPRLEPDVEFIREAAMLHDIGIFLTRAPEIDCHGDQPYIMHGPLGRELLEREGLPRHALVCDRHTGVGISKEDILRQDLPLPRRDMLPVTLEEKIVCFADTFYGKNPQKLRKERPIEKIEQRVTQYGGDNPKRLQHFLDLFGV